MFDYKITNIKLTLKTSFICLDTVKKFLRRKKINFKEYQNFLVIKNIYTYVYFKSSDSEINHLNITNIPEFKKIDIACNHILKNILKPFKIKEIYRRVDNISASLNLNKKIDLLKIVSYFQKICQVSYNTEKFPGVFLKFKYGTIIIFHTGKCIFIGCKFLRNLKCLEKHILTYVNTKIK